MKKPPNHIISHLESELNATAKADFMDALNASPTFNKEVEEVDFLWDLADNLQQQKQINVKNSWDQVKRKMDRMRWQERLLKLSKGIAATSFIPLLCLTGYFLFIQGGKDISPMIEQTSAYGLVSRVVLPDSSIVILNSGSKLTYPLSFKGKSREVSLSGEGYFIVKADKKHRFNVVLPNGEVVSAHGTEFNINAYDGEEWVQTTLVEGNVDITRSKEKNALHLQPGQLATFSTNHQVPIVLSNANIDSQTAWKDGRIVFRRTEMSQVAKRLSLHFNVDIELRDKELYQYEYSATFETESLQDILELLAQSAPIQWKFSKPVKQHDNSYTRQKVTICLKK